MDDLKIEPVLLEETLEVLNNDNNQILKTIKDINNLIKGLDESKWKAPEKDKINQELIPYLEYQENNIYDSLNNCVLLINKAKDNYLAVNSAIEKSTAILEDYSNLGEV